MRYALDAGNAMATIAVQRASRAASCCRSAPRPPCWSFAVAQIWVPNLLPAVVNEVLSAGKTFGAILAPAASGLLAGLPLLLQDG